MTARTGRRAGKEGGAMPYPGRGAGQHSLHAEELGRGPHWRALREAIESVTGGGRALWLTGEPGIGKTVLLDQAGRLAAEHGLRLLRAAGAESEKDLPFAALHQLLWTLDDETRALPPAARAALERAWGSCPDAFLEPGLVAAAPGPAATESGAGATECGALSEPGRVAAASGPAARESGAGATECGALSEPGRVAAASGPAATESGAGATECGALSEPGRVAAAFGPAATESGARPYDGTGPAATGPVVAAATGSAVAAATLDLLAAAARRRPLALLVDDLHWTDASSAEVLHHLQRRLATLPVVLIATLRTGAATGLDPTGCRTLDLAPLTGPDADTLLRRLHPDLAPAARARVLHEAAGNPLALVELPAQLTPDQRTGRLPLPDRLPLGECLEGVYAQRVAALSPSVRRTLLLCALAGHDERSPDLIARAAREAGSAAPDEDLEAAARDGLVRFGEPAAPVTFRHPLVRSSLVAGATGAERRRAHAAWARVLPAGDLRQVQHRAAATAVPDETVAAALDRAARVTAARGAEAEAARLYARAAALSGDAPGRGRRFVTGAAAALRGGRIDLAARLLGQAEATGVPEDARGTLDLARAHVRMQADGDFGPAVALLTRTLDLLPAGPDERANPAADREAHPTDRTAPASTPAALTGQLAPASAPAAAGQLAPAAPAAHIAAATDPVRLQALFLLALCAGFTADPRAWEAVRSRLAPGPGLMALCHDVWNDPARHAHGATRRLEEALRGLPDAGDEPRPAPEVWALLWSAAGLGVLGDHTALWERLVRPHAYVTQNLLETLGAYDDYLRGHWDRCVTRAGTAAAAARARGFRFNERVLSYQAGYVHAARGRHDEVEQLVARLGPWAAARGLTLVVLRLRAMRAACALALGDHESAYAHAAALTPPGTLPAGVGQFQLVFLDLVEAAVRSGRVEGARRHVAAGAAAHLERISPHHAFVLLAARALADEDTDTACAEAYACPHATRWPFELARVRLHHGAWLRRRGRRTEARERLAEARDTFAALDAPPWLARAEEELRVCDEIRPAPAGGDTVPPTPQELRVARLVAEGLTNREIGLRLQLSPRTVSNHLYRLYPKLGVTHRAAVAHALDDHAHLT
ncbi:AAA family ATPase [Streptomyces sp. NPDC015131]|uniref:AAA family ATPase n=1 Tax=Streptomyces sp. NPDC015131 TaxID=3364941 RepID=UPI0037031B63